MFKQFKEFAMNGNVMDMAVGVILGGAFGKIISSMVEDVSHASPGAAAREEHEFHGLLSRSEKRQGGRGQSPR